MHFDELLQRAKQGGWEFRVLSEILISTAIPRHTIRYRQCLNLQIATLPRYPHYRRGCKPVPCMRS